MLRKNFVLVTVLFVALSLVLVGCGGSQPQPQQPAKQEEKKEAPKEITKLEDLKPLEKPVKIWVAEDGSPSGAGFYVAKEKGYFKDLGLDVDIKPFESSGDMLPAIASGQIDVAGGITSVALFNAQDRGLDINIIGDKCSNNPGSSYYSLVVRKDLAGSIKDYKDLKGKKIGLFSKGTLNELTVEKALKKGGLTLKDVELVTMGPSDMSVALGKKAIDLGMHIEPLITKGEKDGLFVRWKDTTDFAPGAQIAVMLASPQFVKEKNEAAKRFMVAYAKGVRDYNDAFVKGIKKDEIIDIMVKHTELKDKELWQKVKVTGLNPDVYANKDGIAADLKWYTDNGHFKGKADMNKLVDHSLADFAIKLLGNYKK